MLSRLDTVMNNASPAAAFPKPWVRLFGKETYGLTSGFRRAAKEAQKTRKRANSAASYFRTESPRIAGVIPRECEAGHILSLASALFMMRHGATPASRTGQMKTRQVANWWFKFVDSGRLLDKFMNLRYNSFVAKALDNELRVRRHGDRKRLSRREIFQG